MKKFLILSLLLGCTVICSCQRQNSAAEQQLAQRKVELDEREDAVIEREKVADERAKTLSKREKALAEKENATANTRPTSADTQGQILDPAEAKAERDRTIEQIRTEMRARVPDNSKMKARDSEKPDLQKLQMQKQRVLEMSGAAAHHSAPTASPATEATSSTSSPSPQ